MRRLAWPSLLGLLGLLGLLACGDGAARFEARGVVREVRPEWRQVVIAHDDIPGLMPAMTMNFDVPDEALLARLEKGQAIDFTLEFTGDAYLVVDARVRGAGDPGEGASLAALAGERAPAPPFRLVDQDGAALALEGLRGRFVLVDFVYTECPGPCPILTSQHVALQRALPDGLRGRVHFVSITLDPERDDAAALRAYAGARGVDLSSWSFLTGPPEAVAEVARGFGVGSLRRADGEIDHLVVSFLLDPEGRIVERYVGLEHGVEELLRDLERHAG